MTLGLYAKTVRYLKPWQVLGRVTVRLKRGFGSTRLPSLPDRLECRLEPRASFPHHDPWNTRVDLLNGQFCFLNNAAVLGWPPDWSAESKQLLWRFNLHYFNYLHLLTHDEGVALCRSWINDSPPSDQVAWHPFPTSLRIVNWSRSMPNDSEILESLYQQAAFLARNVETYVYGNHLLENARALVVAGCLFEGQGESSRWIEKGLEIYRRETPIQILSDGGHFERSPMYHALVLEGYLDVLNVLPHNHSERSWIVDAVKNMTDVLASLTHPDGNLALLNDTTQEIALPAASLQHYARMLTGYQPQPRSSLPETGYFVDRCRDLYLVIDGGQIGPDHLVAHAHADILSYELSIRGRQMVVDTGVYEYAAGDMRQYVRSTKAHNTVCVDGLDQAECWSSFRVARRFPPHDVTYERDERTSRFTATFSGYAKLIGDQIRHRRVIEVSRSNRTISVRDHIDGRGNHDVESRIHLHPEVTVIVRNSQLELRRAHTRCTFDAEPFPLRLERAFYCPQFGRKKENDVIVLGGRSILPVQLSYTFKY